jgi:hypothetical protein
MTLTRGDVFAENTAVGIRCADHATPPVRKSGGGSVGIVNSLTKATEFYFFIFHAHLKYHSLDFIITLLFRTVYCHGHQEAI